MANSQQDTLSEWGVSRTGYLIPGCVGLLPWPWPRILPSSSSPSSPSGPNLQKCKMQKHKITRNIAKLRSPVCADVSVSSRRYVCVPILPQNVDSRPKILKRSSKISRDNVVKKLLDNNIQTRNFFYPMHKQKIFKKLKIFNKNNKYPVSEYLFNNGFYLPSGLGIKNFEIDYVAKTLNKVL